MGFHLKWPLIDLWSLVSTAQFTQKSRNGFVVFWSTSVAAAVAGWARLCDMSEQPMLVEKPQLPAVHSAAPPRLKQGATEAFRCASQGPEPCTILGDREEVRASLPRVLFKPAHIITAAATATAQPLTAYLMSGPLQRCAMEARGAGVSAAAGQPAAAWAA